MAVYPSPGPVEHGGAGWRGGIPSLGALALATLRMQGAVTAMTQAVASAGKPTASGVCKPEVPQTTSSPPAGGTGMIDGNLPQALVESKEDEPEDVYSATKTTTTTSSPDQTHQQSQPEPLSSRPRSASVSKDGALIWVVRKGSGGVGGSGPRGRRARHSAAASAGAGGHSGAAGGSLRVGAAHGVQGQSLPVEAQGIAGRLVRTPSHPRDSELTRHGSRTSMDSSSCGTTIRDSIGGGSIGGGSIGGSHGATSLARTGFFQGSAEMWKGAGAGAMGHSQGHGDGHSGAPRSASGTGTTVATVALGNWSTPPRGGGMLNSMVHTPGSSVGAAGSHAGTASCDEVGPQPQATSRGSGPTLRKGGASERASARQGHGGRGGGMHGMHGMPVGTSFTAGAAALVAAAAGAATIGTSGGGGGAGSSQAACMPGPLLRRNSQGAGAGHRDRHGALQVAPPVFLPVTHSPVLVPAGGSAGGGPGATG